MTETILAVRYPMHVSEAGNPRWVPPGYWAAEAGEQLAAAGVTPGSVEFREILGADFESPSGRRQWSDGAYEWRGVTSPVAKERDRERDEAHPGVKGSGAGQGRPRAAGQGDRAGELDA